MVHIGFFWRSDFFSNASKQNHSDEKKNSFLDLIHFYTVLQYEKVFTSAA